MADRAAVEVGDAPVGREGDFSGGAISGESELLPIAREVVKEVLDIGVGADVSVFHFEDLLSSFDARFGGNSGGLLNYGGVVDFEAKAKFDWIWENPG